MTPAQLDSIGLVVGAVLTVSIFSYLLGDNFLYRLAVHIFIGAAAAFVLITGLESVIIPWINATILSTPIEIPRLVMGFIPFIIGLLLLLKATKRFTGIGAIGLAIVVGVGVAVALWGAVAGTLIPLVVDSGRSIRTGSVVDGVIGFLGTVAVLVTFTYFGRRQRNGEIDQVLPVRIVGQVGQVFITVTLGATYALLIISALTVLTGIVAQRLIPLLPGR